MEFGCFTDETKSETRAFSSAHWLAEGIEAIEYSGDGVVGEAGAFIGYFHLNGVVFANGLDVDGPAVG